MLPISLTLKGFLSYKDSQTIDFTQLTKAGIFGIFGNTGAGKSTLVEAILLALFNDADRMNSRENRVYNFMNLQSNELYIEFTCKSLFTEKLYVATLHAKRNSKNFDAISTTNHQCYRIDNEKKIPITQEKIVQEVTGLNYKNFKQTIIIPQGKFLDFIQLTKSERTQMVNEMFELNKYDLADKTKIIEENLSENLNKLLGKYETVKDITKEHIDHKEEEKQHAEAKGVAQKEKVQHIANTIELAKKEHELLQQHAKKEQKVKEIQAKIPYYKEIETKIQLINNAVSIADIYDDYSVSQKHAEKLKQDILLITKEINTASEKFKTIEKRWNDYNSHKEKLPEVEENVRILDIIIESKREELEKNSLRKEIEKAEQYKQALQKKITAQEHNIETKKLQKDLLVSSITDVSKLHEQKQELETYTKLCKDIEIVREKRLKFIEEIKSIKDNFVKKIADTCSINTQYAQSKAMLTHAIAHTQAEIETLNKTYNLQYAETIVKLRHDLQHNSPCPVCGSQQHNISSVSAEHADYTQIEHLKQDLQLKENQLKLLLQTHETIEFKIKTLEEQEHDESHKMHAYTIERNLNEPDDKSVSIEDIYAKISNAEQALKNLAEAENHIKSLEKEVNTDKHLLQDLQKNLTETHEVLTKKTIRTQTQLETINTEIAQKYANLTIEKLQETHTKYTNFIRSFANYDSQTENTYLTAKEELNNLKIKKIEKEKDSIAQSEDAGTKQKKLSFAMESIAISSLQDLKQILSEKEQLSDYSIRLGTFKESFKTAQTEYNNSLDTIKNIKKTDIHLDKLYEELKIQEELLQDMRQNYSQKLVELQELNKKFTLQKEYTQEIENMQNESKTLAILKNLFREKGFVSYIAEQYLQTICTHANKRFEALTKHALRLEFSDGAFSVRDMLNNGKMRHIKTLSGGQIFQASLSLALALSEIVQTNNPQVSNFFFIDEGFGSQDKESLQAVFSTLSDIKNEGKIVGIISHVEELKENVPTYAYIKNINGSSTISIGK